MHTHPVAFWLEPGRAKTHARCPAPPNGALCSDAMRSCMRWSSPLTMCVVRRTRGSVSSLFPCFLVVVAKVLMAAGRRAEDEQSLVLVVLALNTLIVPRSRRPGSHQQVSRRRRWQSSHSRRTCRGQDEEQRVLAVVAQLLLATWAWQNRCRSQRSSKTRQSRACRTSGGGRETSPAAPVAQAREGTSY